jgi:hypothetical protein
MVSLARLPAAHGARLNRNEAIFVATAARLHRSEVIGSFDTITVVRSTLFVGGLAERRQHLARTIPKIRPSLLFRNNLAKLLPQRNTRRDYYGPSCTS